MQYFGIPKCPYCRKRVNLIRTWSLKRQGEYQCPRCGGISNIFLSPLVYVFALLAVFSGAAVYFFHKFILDDIGLTTCFQVFIPFAVFFLLSLFLVYLAKPVIKRVPREEVGKKKQPVKAAAGAKPGVSGQTGRIYADREEYLPQSDYRTGPFPQNPPVKAPAPQAVKDGAQPTAVMPRDASMSRTAARRPVSPQGNAAPQRQVPAQREASPRQEASPAAQRRRTAQQTAAQVQRPVVSQGTQTQARVSAMGESAPAQPVRQPAPRTSQPAPQRREQVRPQPQVQTPVTPRPQQPVRREAPAARQNIQEPRQASRVVSSVELPTVGGDFFAKYDDPAYVERRLKEIQEKKDKENN